jgi:MYXO-CTERM domain-containing protein
MLRFIAATLVAGTFVLVSSEPAHAFCRTTTVAIPANYNPHDRGCFTDGLYLYWKNQCVSYSISKQGTKVTTLAEATSIINEAFARWPSAVCKTGDGPGITITNIGDADCTEVKFNQTTPNQNLIVFRDDGWPYQDAYSTLGLTTVTFNAKTGEIFDADMEINSSQKNLVAVDADSAIPANSFDLASVVTHEAGHFFGLAHATSTTATMYASYKPGTTALRTLSADDVNGICEIYPDKNTRNVSPAASQSGTLPADACNPEPRNGFTTQCEVPADTSSCDVTPTPRPIGSYAAVGLVGLGLVALRRRRR